MSPPTTTTTTTTTTPHPLPYHQGGGSLLIKNMKYHLILHRNHLPNYTENPRSNLIQDAQVLTNIGMKLLS